MPPVHGELKANRHALGVTSLWLLVPGALGFRHFLLVNDSWAGGTVSALCVVCSFVSVLHWQRCKEHSILHRADRALGVVFFLALCVYTRSEFSPRQLSLYAWACFPISVSAFYMGARICGARQWIRGNLLCHLMF